jgi:putative hemolysin
VQPNKLLLFFKKLFFRKSSRSMTGEGLRIALEAGEKSGVVESEKRTMLEGVIHLGEKPVGALMTHRSEIEWLDIEAGVEEAKTAAENAVYQNFLPVVRGDLDDVAGAVSVRDLLRSLLDSPWPGLKPLLRPPYFIPETMSPVKAFKALKKADANDLFVMDEYGGFAGILTIRSLIEEIVGELSAASDDEETIVRQEDGTWIADGGISVEDAAEELGLKSLGAKSLEYHTLAGFILDLAGEIPRPGAHFDYAGYRFKIASLDGNRIDKIIISAISGQRL